MQVAFVKPDGLEKTVDCRVGDNPMQTALNSGFRGIAAECGGSACATCQVYVDEDPTRKTGERSDGEKDKLHCAISEMRHKSRMSCQLILGDGLDGLPVHSRRNKPELLFRDIHGGYVYCSSMIKYG